MAVIFKKSINNKKGLIILSHREKRLFDRVLEGNPVLKKTFLLKYFVVLHVGCFLEKIKESDYIDKYFFADGNVKYLSNLKNSVLFISSRDFIPNEFSYANEEKKIDVIAITTAALVKDPGKLIKFAEALIATKKEFKAVFVLTYPKESSNISFDNSLEERFWKSIRRDADRRKFSFIALRVHENVYPLPRWFIADLMKRSKYYFHACVKEGESRTIGEALAAHCQVLFPSELQGGAGVLSRENHNCYAYNTEEEAADMVFGCSSYDLPDFSDNIKIATNNFLNYCLERNICTEKEFRSKLSSCDFSMYLPGHVHREYVEESSPDGYADILSAYHLVKFFEYLGINYTFNFFTRFRIFYFSYKRKILQWTISFFKRLFGNTLYCKLVTFIRRVVPQNF